MPRSPDRRSSTAASEVLGGYRLLDVLGEGGMGVVYRAEDVSLGRIVALKRIRPDLAQNEAFLRRFRTEARALARIQSPFIVGIHALRETDDGLLIDMEYVDGPTLKEVLDAESPLPLSRALPLCTHILRAFEDAHQAGVIHRDVKPHNVLLPHAGGVKVTDFGLARMGGNSDETVTQGVAGTLKYMSPEQVQGSADLDARSDLFSLGLLFFEVLTGRLPFAEDARDFDIMRTIVEEDLPGPRSIRPALPPDLDRVVRRLLRRDPEERYASASETLADLEDLRRRNARTSAESASASGAPPASAATTSPEAPATGSAIRLVLGGGVLLALLLAGAAWLGLLPGVFSGPEPAPYLTVTSDPAGATVFANGDRIGTTPLRNASLAAGPQVLRLERPGYRPLDTTITVASSSTVLALSLRPAEAEPAAPAAPARLTVASTPPGAAVFAGAARIGTTPLSDTPLPEDAAEIRLERTGFLPHTAPIRTGPGERLDLGTIALRAEPRTDPPPTEPAPSPATLRLRVPGGTVSVNGSDLPASGVASVAPGVQRIAFRHPDHGVFDTTLTAAPGSTTDLVYHVTHPVTVNTIGPWGSVWINGENRGHTPLSLDLGPGEHRVEVRIERSDAFTVAGGSHSRRTGEGPAAVQSFAGSETVVRVSPGPVPVRHTLSFTVQ